MGAQERWQHEGQRYMQQKKWNRNHFFIPFLLKIEHDLFQMFLDIHASGEYLPSTCISNSHHGIDLGCLALYCERQCYIKTKHISITDKAAGFKTNFKEPDA